MATRIETDEGRTSRHGIVPRIDQKGVANRETGRFAEHMAPWGIEHSKRKRPK